MALTESQITNISVLLNTFHGFHKTRRRQGLYISHCFVLLACTVLEASNRGISEGAVRNILTMFHGNKLSYLFRFLSERGYLVFTRSDKRGKYYTLTDKGRETTSLLLDGIEARQVAFYNKYLGK